jgi:hypothetical protein
MRICVAALVCMIFTARTGWADETLPVLKVGSDVYSNVTVTTVTPTEIFFNSSQGMGNVKLDSLDPALQKHFRQVAAVQTAAAAQKPAAPAASPADAVTIDRANAQSIMAETIRKVQDIVNQPVTRLQRTPDMHVTFFSPGWFHPGAIRPEFNIVDIRTTQEFDYDAFPYVSSDLNPGVVFIGPELEFNPMTKYFYTDRTSPKKKLTEAEMLEINRLYRIIGRCEEKMNETDNLESPADPGSRWAVVHRFAVKHEAVIITLIVALLGTLVVIRQRRARTGPPFS